MNSLAEDMKAVLLVGGMGKRLRSVVSFTPKPIAPVGNRPFI
jgi:D-glycero-alpha-D-manno-heptose 1-phosphate guanylyltransferase